MSANVKRLPLKIVDKTDSIAAGMVTRTADVIDSLLVFGLCALLIFGALAFGSVDEWAIHIFEIAATGLFTLWVGKQLVQKELKLSSNPLYVPACLLFALVIAQLALHRTAYWYITQYEALKYVSYGIVLLLVAESVSGEDARRSFAVIMMIFGALYAFFALVQSLTSTGKIYWVHTPQFGRDVFGSYVNRDHYAGLIEMLVPFPLVLSTGHLLDGSQRALAAFGGALMASTIFLSGSRAGIVIFALQLVLFAVLTSRIRHNYRAMLGSIAGLVLVGALLAFLGKWQFLSRFGNLDSGLRLSITKDSLRMFLERPVLGWGLGTFPTVYPGHRSFYTNLFVNQAHNDYAQLLVETGLLGFTLMIWFVIALYRRSLAAVSAWPFRWGSAVSLAALLGCSGILLHSFVDFNLQIPANAAVFYVMCALTASPLPKQISKQSSLYSQASACEGMVPGRSKIQ